jgi:ribonuclease-3
MADTLIIQNIQDIIGYSFVSPSILERALRRKAYAQEHNLPDDYHMDAYATLGDAVIELLILTRLVRDGGTDKGIISVQKMDLVNMSVLRQSAEKIHISQHVQWGKGEERMHIWTSGRVLAECFEALIGAVYLDGGLSAAEQILDNVNLFPMDKNIASGSGIR